MDPSLKRKIKNSFFWKYLKPIREYTIFRLPHFSYSQTGEDLLLDFFLKGKRKGFYIDIGAYHPIFLSNTYKFYKRGWKGIVVEPNFKRYNSFPSMRPRDIALNIGLGKVANKHAKFFILNDDVLSTFSHESALSSEREGSKIEKSVDIEVITLATLFETYVGKQEVDFLSIDTEGHDLPILESNDWTRFRPHFLVVETVEYCANELGKKQNDMYDPYMTSIGYRKIADTYLNTFYVDQQYISKP